MLLPGTGTSTALAPVDEIPETDASNDLLIKANGDDTIPELVLLILTGLSGLGALELNVVVPISCPSTGLKSTASASSNSPSGSRPPRSTLLGTYLGMSLYSIPE